MSCRTRAASAPSGPNPGRWLIGLLVVALLGPTSGVQGQTLRFDAPEENAEASDTETEDAETDTRPAQGLLDDWRFRLESGLLEFSALTASDRPQDWTTHGRSVLRADRAIGTQWEVRLGARIDAYAQQGGDYPAVSTAELDYGENFLRYRAMDWQMTLGTQKLLWGRVDETPPTDRLSTKDLTRFALDELADRRRASPAARLEYFQGPWKLDLVGLIGFRAAELPEDDSIWHPVDREAGRLLGLDPEAELPDGTPLSTLIQDADFGDAPSGRGGGGLRISRDGQAVDFAATLQRVRHSQPYYRLSAESQAELGALSPGDPPPPVTFDAEHPMTWVVGGDLGFATGGWTWRMEAAWLSDVPITREADFAYDKTEGFDWVIGTEGFPTPRDDLRLTVQLLGEHLLDAEDALDPDEIYYINGEIEDFFLRNEWRARLRFSAALNRRDNYLNPELAWIAAEPNELFLGGHWMGGEDDSLGGFYRDRRLLVAGWRGQF